MSETDLSEEIESEECEHHDPDSEIYLSVEDPPVVSLVSNAEELETESNLYESEHNLDRVKPASAALLELLEK